MVLNKIARIGTKLRKYTRASADVLMDLRGKLSSSDELGLRMNVAKLTRRLDDVNRVLLQKRESFSKETYAP